MYLCLSTRKARVREMGIGMVLQVTPRAQVRPILLAAVLSVLAWVPSWSAPVPSLVSFSNSAQSRGRWGEWIKRGKYLVTSISLLREERSYRSFLLISSCITLARIRPRDHALAVRKAWNGSSGHTQPLRWKTSSAGEGKRQTCRADSHQCLSNVLVRFWAKAIWLHIKLCSLI